MTNFDHNNSTAIRKHLFSVILSSTERLVQVKAIAGQSARNANSHRVIQKPLKRRYPRPSAFQIKFLSRVKNGEGINGFVAFTVNG